MQYPVMRNTYEYDAQSLGITLAQIIVDRDEIKTATDIKLETVFNEDDGLVSLSISFIAIPHIKEGGQ